MEDLSALKSCKLLIFDVGGVLRDSRHALHEAYRAAFESQGIQFDFAVDDTWHLRGLLNFHDRRQALRAMLASQRAKISLGKVLSEKEPEKALNTLIDAQVTAADGELIENMSEAYRSAFYAPETAALIKTYPGIRVALEHLKKNYKLAIFTNTKKDSVHRDLPDIVNLFSCILSEEDVKRKKPSGEGIIKVLEHFKLDASKAAYVGDSQCDIAASREAGTITVAVVCGMGKREWLAEADYVFKDVVEMAETLAK